MLKSVIRHLLLIPACVARFVGRATAGSSQLSYKQFKSKVRLLDALLPRLLSSERRERCARNNNHDMGVDLDLQ